ncbi:uncharacterized protein LOC134213192 [Armigeres subalbatus]|uniref:uncharacterized protein LOC134213192 n=1 Tax=Armigeres subalbatus TaxID=124917 RepID=UPI002ED4216C
MWLNLVIVGFLLNVVRLVNSCPTDVCVCKWKGGKQTVECGGQQLPRIPEEMDPGTQVLNFSGNALTVLQNERFKKLDLINLQKIYLSRNQLMRIHEKAFKGLTNLVELDLSENSLTAVPTETFSDYPALMRLTLSGNPIRTLQTNAFKHLSYLTTLELSNCQIDLIEDEAFIGMDNLEWLRLDGNRITTIQGNHVLPENLHGINLQANRWQCDCRLLDIHTWLNSFNVPQRQEEPKCSGPLRLAGQIIKTIQPEDLACLPIITPDSLYREISEGRNMSLTCKISAVPEASVSWWFQGQLLQNDSLLANNLHLYHYSEDFGDEKRSELLIYNISPEDNGTFSCIAENSAGRVQANYTLHVIVKEEPVVEEVSFSQEHFLIIVAASAATGFLLFLTLCIIICKCSKRSSKRISNTKSRGKSGSDTIPNSQKCASITNDIGESLTCAKINGTVAISESNPQDVVLYLNTGANLEKAGLGSLQLGGQAQFCSPPSARSYQDQNPDLINDAESGNKIRARPDAIDSDVGEKDSDEQSSVQDASSEASFQQSYFQTPMGIRPVAPRISALSTLPRGINKDMYQHQVDIHLSPGCFLDQNGYPVDLNVVAQGGPTVNYYRTLPHNRGQKGQQNKVRYSNDAEFITRTSQTYQLYGVPPDVRYTAEGYPQQPGVDASGTSQFPSPPEGYKGEPLTVQGVQALPYMNPPAAFCVGPSTPQQWPTFLPGYHPHQLIPIAGQAGADFNRYLPPAGIGGAPGSSSPSPALPPVLKKCVGAQTGDMTLDKDTIPEQREEEEEAEHENGSKLRHLTGPLADSPDEGYVGEGHESTDI